jgi:large subunit ribosomal protein L17
VELMMRHRVAGRKLGRSSGHRKALYRNLITDLLRHERLQTTEAKARAIRGKAEKLITLSRRGQTDTILDLAKANDEQRLAALVQTKRAKKLLALVEQAQALVGEEQAVKEAELEQTVRAMGVHARRQAAARLTDPQVVHKLFDELGPRYQDRPGGYTRILKLGQRQGDGAQMALIELVAD